MCACVYMGACETVWGVGFRNCPACFLRWGSQSSIHQIARLTCQWASKISLFLPPWNCRVWLCALRFVYWLFKWWNRTQVLCLQDKCFIDWTILLRLFFSLLPWQSPDDKHLPTSTKDSRAPARHCAEPKVGVSQGKSSWSWLGL